MEKNYAWKSGAQFPVSAKTAAETILSLRRTLNKDTVTAKELLDASRDENAPLHPCYEWNDSIAAENYRLVQSGQIIRSIEVVIVKNDEPVKTRGFVNVVQVAPKHQGEYAPIEIALVKDNYRKQFLKNALDELRAFQRKYAVYTELSGVFKAIDAFADAIQ